MIHLMTIDDSVSAEVWSYLDRNAVDDSIRAAGLPDMRAGPRSSRGRPPQ